MAVAIAEMTTESLLPPLALSTCRSTRFTPVAIPANTLLPFLELGFALYFTYFVITAAIHGQWLSLPFLVLFQGGFGYVAISSMAQWFPKVNLEPDEPADAVPA